MALDESLSRTNTGLFDKAKTLMPGGVNSPVRSFRSVGGTPYFVDRAEGPYIFDVEGNRYIDYVMSYGPAILGHADPDVIGAVTQAASAGTSYGAPTVTEIELAEALCARVPGLEMIRLTSSGTEATMSALRLARSATGRSTIIKFAGCYHGHADALLAEGGSGIANQGISGSAGVSDGSVADTVVAPYNVIPEIDSSVAAVIVEPVAANMGLVAPNEGFLSELRQRCSDVGALLIFDEVITGFRLAAGGATEFYGVVPDIWAFGKVIGGGLPVGCFGASAEVMSNVAPLGPMYQGGTLSGNPLATAAGVATLKKLDAEAYVSLQSRSDRLADGLKSAFENAGVSAVLPQVGPLLGLFFGEEQPSNFDEVKVLAENGVYQRFFHEMLDRGVSLAPGAYEIVFPSLAHSDDVIDETIAIATEAAQAL